MLAAILEMARDAARHDSKQHRLGMLLRRARQPAIVFTEYRDTLMQLALTLATHRPLLLHGGLSPGERRDTIRQFTDGRAGLLLATDAASEGLNLHERCRLVVNLELPWTPLRLEQRSGRVDRIGQPRRVHVIHLVARATAEETTVAALCHRQARAERALHAIDNAAVSEDAVLQAIVDRTPASGKNTKAEARWRSVRAPAADAEREATFSVDLRDASHAEARAVARARMLAGRGAGSLPVRPSATVIRRRSRAAALWVFRFGVADARGHALWDTLVGVHASRVAVVPRTPDDLRQWLARTGQGFRKLLQRERERVLLELERDIRRPLMRALRRERAILEALHDEQGRLAALLLQPGLFDRRSDRAAEAQRRIADAAVARGHQRLEDLNARRRLLSLDEELVLAVVLG